MSWGITYKTKLNQLSSKLNKCVRCIFFAHRHENIRPYYKLLKILNFENLIKLKIASFIHEIVKEDNASIFNETLLPLSRVHTHYTRLSSKNNYYRSSIKTNYGKFTFKFIASQIWEDVPTSFQSLSLNFKKMYKNYLICNHQ